MHYLENHLLSLLIGHVLPMIIADFVAHGSNVNCLALSPSNGHMLATGGDDKRVNLWLVGKPNNIMVS